MKKIKLIAPILGAAATLGTAIPLASCQKEQADFYVRHTDDIALSNLAANFGKQFKTKIKLSITDKQIINCIVNRDNKPLVQGPEGDYTVRFFDEPQEGYVAEIVVSGKAMTSSNMEITVETGLPEIKGPSIEQLAMQGSDSFYDVDVGESITDEKAENYVNKATLPGFVLIGSSEISKYTCTATQIGGRQLGTIVATPVLESTRLNAQEIPFHVDFTFSGRNPNIPSGKYNIKLTITIGADKEVAYENSAITVTYKPRILALGDHVNGENGYTPTIIPGNVTEAAKTFTYHEVMFGSDYYNIDSTTKFLYLHPLTELVFKFWQTDADPTTVSPTDQPKKDDGSADTLTMIFSMQADDASDFIYHAHGLFYNDYPLEVTRTFKFAIYSDWVLGQDWKTNLIFGISGQFIFAPEA